MGLKNRIKKINIPDFEERFKTLSPREKRYFKLIRSQSGVLFLSSKPGVGKSAIAKSIAEKMGMNYMQLILSMRDETDVGLFPHLDTVVCNDTKIKVLSHVVPKWAHDANSRPTLVLFDEMNRAPLAVRNAALQLLLERAIDVDFKFNENVFMMGAGNLGDEDGTDVEEFDTALNGRLIHIKHDMPPQEWIKEFARENVHPDIVTYIENHPHKLYVEAADDSPNGAYASNRSWTFLSDYIVNNYGNYYIEESENGPKEVFSWGDSRDYLPDLEEDGMGFIGNEILGFIQFISERIKISVLDIINDYDKVKDEVEKWREVGRRDRYSEILRDIKEMNIPKLSDKQSNNVISFLKLCAPDERTSFLLDIVDDLSIDVDDMSNSVEKILYAFSDDLTKLRRINKEDKK